FDTPHHTKRAFSVQVPENPSNRNAPFSNSSEGVKQQGLVVHLHLLTFKPLHSGRVWKTFANCGTYFRLLNKINDHFGRIFIGRTFRNSEIINIKNKPLSGKAVFIVGLSLSNALMFGNRSIKFSCDFLSTLVSVAFIDFPCGTLVIPKRAL
ncbi:hypothetical protein, partial [Bacillus norwichensis]